MDKNSTIDVSRRAALKQLSFWVFAIPVAIAAGASSSEAQGKTAKAKAEYQDRPKGEQQCSRCVHFIPEKACMIVDGEISPQGWCKFWKSKGA